MDEELKARIAAVEVEIAKDRALDAAKAEADRIERAAAEDRARSAAENKAYLESLDIRFAKSCECGCGLPIPPLKRANRPRRYIAGHYRKDHSGRSFKAEWRAFHHAKNRCTNPRNADYPDYGGRGIQFLFVNLDQLLQFAGPRPSPDHSLDRIDVNGPYGPGNVRWATATEQANNRRPRRNAEDEVNELLGAC